MIGPSSTASGDQPADYPLIVERTTHEGRDRIVVHGELDAFTGPNLSAAILDATSIEVELDLAAVTFIDSSGLATIVEGHQRLQQAERRLVIVERSVIVQRLFDLAGLTDRLDLEHEPIRDTSSTL